MEICNIFESKMNKKCDKYSILEGGFTNKTYLIYSEGKKYVLRVPGVGTNEYINRSFEIENMNTISKLNITPNMYYVNIEDGIIISEYIEGNVPIENKDINDDFKLKLICKTLSKLHSSNIKLSNTFDVIEMKRQYTKVLDNMNVDLPEKFKNSISKLDDAMGFLFTKYPIELVPCHCDPKLNNFLLQSDKLYVIDWEYSGMADSYFDLVNIVMTNKLTEEEEIRFLDMYQYCSNTVLINEKYILYKVITDYVWIYWHLIKLYQGQMVEYNEASWNNRLERALKNIERLEVLI